ncbi:MAG TPA: hypothetical protein V6D19_13015 [Stenomitos sp.]
MGTVRQKRAIKRIVENGGNVSRAMMEVGYSPATAKTPQKLTNSQGFKELCDELGLTDNLIVTALVDDIKSKPGNRKPELELASKIKGHLKDNPGGPTFNQINIFNDDQSKNVAERLTGRSIVDDSYSIEEASG